MIHVECARKYFSLSQFGPLFAGKQELRRRPLPVIFAAFSGGPKACMYKVLQVFFRFDIVHLFFCNGSLIDYFPLVVSMDRIRLGGYDFSFVLTYFSFTIR